MNVPHSNALVFFGATGDLIYKKCFPTLDAMERWEHLQATVIGVARPDWINRAVLRARPAEVPGQRFYLIGFVRTTEK